VTLTLNNQGEPGTVYNHRTVLSTSNRIRVVGDPGSGKSSLVKRLFRDEAYRALEKPRRSRMPILLELKTLSVPKQAEARLGDWFLHRLRELAGKSRVYQMKECFDTYAENTGLLVLLDGLDEVPSARYQRVQSAIIALSDKLAQIGPNNTIVLTMRTQFHQQVKDSYRNCFGPALFLRPFTPTDIYEFLTRWPFTIERDSNIARIYGELTDRPTLREMCSNPLVLAMYVAEDQTAGHVVAPESRTEFYRKVTEELIIKRRLQQTGPTPAYTALREQRERILGALAYSHMLDETQPINSLQMEEALATIGAITGCSLAQAEKSFKEIAKETGLVSEERAGQTFRFIHLTFCEFMAAFEAVQGQSDGWSALVNFHSTAQADEKAPEASARLLEVIPFACGLLPRVQREQAISDVAALQNDSLLARCFLETKQYTHSCWPEFVIRQKQQLIQTPESRWDERWLRDLHLFNVVVRDAADCSAHIPVAPIDVDLEEFFEALAGSQKESLAKLLAAYAAQDAAAAFRLAEVSGMDLVDDFPDIVINYCDQAPFLALTIERMLRDTRETSKHAALLAEAGLRSQVVAKSLNETPASERLTKIIVRFPKRKRWYRRGIVEESLYTQLLTIATASSDLSVHRFLCIDALRRVKAPGDLWIAGISGERAILSLILAAVYGLGMSVLLPQMKNNPPSGAFVTFTMGFVSISTVLMMFLMTKFQVYRALIFPGSRLQDALQRAGSRVLFPLHVSPVIALTLNFYMLMSKDLKRAFKTINMVKEASTLGRAPST
jgi:GTPase SAR1 family protein